MKPSERATAIFDGIGEKVRAGDGKTRYDWMRYADRDRFIQRVGNAITAAEKEAFEAGVLEGVNYERARWNNADMRHYPIPTYDDWRKERDDE